MASSLTPATTELVVLRVLPTAVRCRDATGSCVTYRRSLHAVVPGQALGIRVERRWTFHRQEMVGGPLLHAGFSLRALSRAGLRTPVATLDGLSCPAEGQPGLAEADAELARGDWLGARCLLLDVLELEPGSLVAHSRMARLLDGLDHRQTALLHATAAIRLGLGALTCEDCLPLDATRPVERALLEALTIRASLHERAGHPDRAAADLRRALSWDAGDRLGARTRLDQLAAAQHGPSTT